MSAGYFIYAGFKPCLKMMLTIGAGYGLSKSGRFPPAASKGLSQLTIYVALPSLLFSTIVMAFNSSNAGNIGPLLMIAIVYSFIGLAFSLIIAELFYIPSDFKWGFLVLGWASNWGNLSASILETVAKQPPFGGLNDRDLGIAYSSIFVLVLQVSFYGTGLYKVCGWDFRADTSEEAQDRRGIGARLKQRRDQIQKLVRRKPRRSEPPSTPEITCEADMEAAPRMPIKETDDGISLAPMGSPNEDTMSKDKHLGTKSDSGMTPVTRAKSPAYPTPPVKTPWYKIVLRALNACVSPVSIVIPIAITVALVNPLKALFVPVAGWSDNRIHSAPDHAPPLSFLYEFAVFLGGMAIPAGLIQLGSSFARIQFSRPLSELPLAAIGASVLAKYALRPVVGIFIVKGLQKGTSMFPVEDKMLSFTVFLMSGTPSSASQSVATMLFCPEGKSPDTLAAFLGAQYAFLLIGSSAQTAISLWLVS